MWNPMKTDQRRYKLQNIGVIRTLTIFLHVKFSIAMKESCFNSRKLVIPILRGPTSGKILWTPISWFSIMIFESKIHFQFPRKLKNEKFFEKNFEDIVSAELFLQFYFRNFPSKTNFLICKAGDVTIIFQLYKTVYIGLSSVFWGFMWKSTVIS